MSQYLDLFLQEAEEQLELLERELVRLESDPTPERLQAIFRSAHTIKGSSGAMGFAQIAELTHEMESVLDRLRQGELVVDSACADLLLLAIDSLAQMVECVRTGQGEAENADAVVRALRDLQIGQSATQVECAELDSATSQAIDLAARSSPVYRARFRLSADCVMKFVRVFMAISQVQEAGELLASIPDAEALEEERFESEFELIFRSNLEEAQIKEGFASISEIDSFELAQWVLPASAADIVAPEEGIERTRAPRIDSGQTVRVGVTRLDSLMNLVGELVIDRTRIAQIARELGASGDARSLDDLNETVIHIARITGELQDQIMKARMLPIETVFNRFPRTIRDLAQRLSKEVHLEIKGSDTELDRSVIEVIGDPLLHILRNSVDHGIESPAERRAVGKSPAGRITICARHHESHIVIEIADDGRGIDIERVKEKAIAAGITTADAAARLSDPDALSFVFHSGLSTAEELSEVSGRGVGMDIVRTNIQKLGGVVELESWPGQGTRFTLRLPLTLAIIRGLLVNVAGTTIVLPLTSVVETLRVLPGDIQRVNRSEVVVVRGKTIPLVRLAEELGLGAAEPFGKPKFAVIVGLADQQVGFIVDALVGEQEVVIKSLDQFCGEAPGISGATILGDGNVALIADVSGILLKDRR